MTMRRPQAKTGWKTEKNFYVDRFLAFLELHKDDGDVRAAFFAGIESARAFDHELRHPSAPVPQEGARS